MFAPLGLALATLPVVFAVTHDVSVGAGGVLKFDPEFVTAATGDIVQFVFHPKNHTVTQSSFDSPCVPLQGGTDSGFMPVAAETGALPTFQWEVKDVSAPIWIHCRQPNPTLHCSQGMVFAVNPPAEGTDNSFTNFKAKALASGSSPSTSNAASTGAASAATPPPPHWAPATATVAVATATWTTTYTSYDGTPPPTPAAQPVDHKIIVGDGGKLVYNPSNITASIGDTVTFEFRPKNHTVTQSSFLNPCVSLAESSGGQQVGFKSGFVPVAPDAQSPFPTFQIKINDTAPIWGYCGQTGHCAAGMVFSINAVESGPNNFGAFKGIAGKLGSGTSPSTPSSTSKPNSAIHSLPGVGTLVLMSVAMVNVLFL